MKHLLDFRTQIFSPKLPEKLNRFSGVEVLNFHEEDVDLPQILIVYELNSEEIFESRLVSQLIKDVFHDYFFKKEFQSNNQVAEEAILSIKHKLIKILKASEKNKLDLNLICGIFFENKLSIVRYGKTYATLVRDGAIKDLEFASEGYFGSTQGNVKHSDVLIFSTEKFYEKFINQDLLSRNLKFDEEDLEPTSSSLIFMFFKGATQDVKTVVGTKSKKYAKQTSKFISKNINFILLVSFISFSFFGYRYYQGYQERKNLEYFNGLISETNFLIQTTGEEPSSFSEKLLTQIQKVNDSNVNSKEELLTKLKSKYNQVNNVKEVTYKVLYDFKEVNPRIKLNSFIIFNDNYYILDQDTSKVYSSKVSELKFDSYETKIDKPIHIDRFTKSLTVINNSTVYYFAPDMNKNDAEIKLGEIGIPRVYMGFIYELKDNKITRVDSNSDTPARELWAESNKIKDARDLAIDYDIYVLDKDSNLLKFTKGILQDLKFNNSKYTFNKMFIDSNLSNNYFVSENKIFQYSKEGDLKNIYSDPSFNEKITDFVILKDKKIIFISNSKLVELDL